MLIDIYQFEVNVVSLLKTSCVVNMWRAVCELRSITHLSIATELHSNWLHIREATVSGLTDSLTR